MRARRGVCRIGWQSQGNGGARRRGHSRVPTGYFVISQAGRFCPRSSPPRWEGTGGCPGCAASAWRARHFPARPMAMLAACSISLDISFAQATRARGSRTGFWGALWQLPWSPALRPALLHAACAASASGLGPRPRRAAFVHYNIRAVRCSAWPYARKHARLRRPKSPPRKNRTMRSHRRAERGRPPHVPFCSGAPWGVGASWAPAL